MESLNDEELNLPKATKKQKINLQLTIAALEIYLTISNIFIIYTFFVFFVPPELFKINIVIAAAIGFLVKFIMTDSTEDVIQRLVRLQEITILKKFPTVYFFKRTREVELIAFPIVFRPILAYIILWIFHQFV